MKSFFRETGLVFKSFKTEIVNFIKYFEFLHVIEAIMAGNFLKILTKKK